MVIVVECLNAIYEIMPRLGMILSNDGKAESSIVYWVEEWYYPFWLFCCVHYN